GPLKMTSGISEPLKVPLGKQSADLVLAPSGVPPTKPRSQSGDRASYQRLFAKDACSEPEGCLLTWSEGQKASILSSWREHRGGGTWRVAGQICDRQLHVAPANWHKLRAEPSIWTKVI